MSCKTRRHVPMKCGEDRFPKPPPLTIAVRATPKERSKTCGPLDDDHKTFNYSPKVLIHGWQKRRLRRAKRAADAYRDCARCADIKSTDWSPDVIIRRREHPATIFQSPLRGDEEESRCLYATRLKSWYDEHYNDWAKRYVRERLYGADGVDRAAIYMYTKLVPPPPQPGKKIGPVKVLGEQEFEITECWPQNYGLLEKKQAGWRKDIDIMLGRSVPDTTHHVQFPSAYRTAVRQPPPPPPAACLRPRRRYTMAERTMPWGEKEVCIHCEETPIPDRRKDHVDNVPCVEALLAV